MDRLKLSKTSWIILSIGIFAVVFVGLGLTRYQQFKEQSRLNDELGIAEMRLEKFQAQQLGQQMDELQAQLDESTVQLAAAKDSLRRSVESVDVTDEFFAIARSCGVTIAGMTTSSIGSSEVGDVACSSITLNAGVSGETADLVDFIARLNSDFTTGVVKSAQISVAAAEEDSESESSANIMIVVHAYEGG
jgi:uncharacterized membrane-anchored protein YhcB (DUF1043 family)